MIVPLQNDLNDSTAVTVLFMKVSGGRAGGFLLKSTIISTVLSLLSSRLLMLIYTSKVGSNVNETKTNSISQAPTSPSKNSKNFQAKYTKREKKGI